MRFLVLGDIHAHLKIINILIEEHPEVDAVLQAGDIGIWKTQDFLNWGYLVDKRGHWNIVDTMVPFQDVVKGKYKFDKPLICITGNHENFDYRDSIDWKKLAKEQVGWLGVCNNFTSWGLENIKIAGLNGCYSYKVYTDQYQKRRKIKVKPETPPHIEEYLNRVMGRDPRGRFTKKDIDTLKKQKADILLLHEVPIGLFNDGDLAIAQKPGCSPINDLIETMQPRVAFCGHFHRHGEMQIGRTRVIGLPMVYDDRYNLVSYGIFDTNDWKFELIQKYNG